MPQGKAAQSLQTLRDARQVTKFAAQGQRRLQIAACPDKIAVTDHVCSQAEEHIDLAGPIAQRAVHVQTVQQQRLTGSSFPLNVSRDSLSQQAERQPARIVHLAAGAVGLIRQRFGVRYIVARDTEERQHAERTGTGSGRQPDFLAFHNPCQPVAGIHVMLVRVPEPAQGADDAHAGQRIARLCPAQCSADILLLSLQPRRPHLLRGTG